MDNWLSTFWSSSRHVCFGETFHATCSPRETTRNFLSDFDCPARHNKATGQEEVEQLRAQKKNCKPLQHCSRRRCLAFFRFAALSPRECPKSYCQRALVEVSMASSLIFRRNFSSPLLVGSFSSPPRPRTMSYSSGIR